MKRARRKLREPQAIPEDVTLTVENIEFADAALAPRDEREEKQLRKKAAYLLVHGAPTLLVNTLDGGKYRLLSGEDDYRAARLAGFESFTAKAYRFNEKQAAIFAIVQEIKSGERGAMETAYLMKRLISEYGRTQEEIAEMTERSRPAGANTLRLLTLAPEVVGLVESGQLSAGHARALVSVPKEKQVAFAEETIRRDYSVRETERAVKAFLTPPEVLQSEKAAAAAAKSEQLKAFVERMRAVFRTKVSLIGNDKKGRIYIDYYSAEDLYRFEEFLDMIESFDRP